jgi:hypothetical protein
VVLYEHFEMKLDFIVQFAIQTVASEESGQSREHGAYRHL